MRGGLTTEATLRTCENCRPADYVGCSKDGTNFNRAAVPAGLFGLAKLEQLNLEYSCSGGRLDGFGNLTRLTSLQLHGNYFSGTIPTELGR